MLDMNGLTEREEHVMENQNRLMKVVRSIIDKQEVSEQIL